MKLDEVHQRISNAYSGCCFKKIIRDLFPYELSIKYPSMSIYSCGLYICYCFFTSCCSNICCINWIHIWVLVKKKVTMIKKCLQSD